MKFCIVLLCYATYCMAKPQLGFSEFSPFGRMMVPNVDSESDMIEGFVDSKKIKTKTTVENKDGVKTVTTTKKGPHYFSKVTRMSGGREKGRPMKIKDFDKIGPSPLLLGGVPMMMSLMGEAKQLFGDVKRNNSCKSCKATQYCNGWGECQDKKVEGGQCLSSNECKKGLFCIWGFCNKGEEGEAGTLCKNNTDCDDGLCCLITEKMERNICSPRLSEGSPCNQNQGFKMSTMSFGFGDRIKKRDTDEQCVNPCQDGLECKYTGPIASDAKMCMKKELKSTSPKDVEEEDESSGEEDEASDEEGSDHGDKAASNKIEPTTTDGTELPDSNKNKNSDKKKKGAKKVAQKNTKAKGKKKDNKHIQFHA